MIFNKAAGDETGEEAAIPLWRRWRGKTNHKNNHRGAQFLVIISKLSYSNFRWSIQLTKTYACTWIEHSDDIEMLTHVFTLEHQHHHHWQQHHHDSISPALPHIHTVNNRKLLHRRTREPMLDKYYAILVELSCNKLCVSSGFFQPSTFAIANAFTFYGMDRNYRVIVCWPSSSFLLLPLLLLLLSQKSLKMVQNVTFAPLPQPSHAGRPADRLKLTTGTFKPNKHTNIYTDTFIET